jgi:hypothetical protein
VSGAGTDTTCAGAPPLGSAANDFGRIAARKGASPSNSVSTRVFPPKMAAPTTTLSPSVRSDVPFVSTGRSSFTDSREIASRPS